ncbi:MAG: peptide chain release factor 2 [Chloroflexi bacterium]|nr:peptide chain release factor 2 [Chloroflexota bacterium]
MQELKTSLIELKEKVSDLLVRLDLPSKELEIQQLEKESIDPLFWQNSDLAQSKMKILAAMNTQVSVWKGFQEQIENHLELLELANPESDMKLLDEIKLEVDCLEQAVAEQEFTLTLSGEHDQRDAILALHAGAGGVDSQDWASMLVRMYTRWCDRKGFGCQILDVSHGEESGIKSVVVQVAGEYAYGHLKAEKGVHRLVRISPFDNDHARHTSFALAEVIPRMEEGADIEINPDDLRVDVFRAGGHGGQSVQKNSTAIRITHEPTGIVVTCQNERSQRQNREIAMRILASRLADLERERKDREISDLKGDHISAEWGNQIRSYVLHPYQMVKDHRTDMETSATSEVLDGDIDMFIKEYLKYQMGT